MKCDGCTLCCMVLPVPWLDKKAGIWCPHCDVGVGCKLWSNGISDDCKSFTCAYNQTDGCSISLRPDKCKIIFEKVDDTMFLGTMHPDYSEAYEKDVIQKELIAFYKRGFSVIIDSFSIDKAIIYPAENRKISEVWSNFQEQVKRKYDSTFIHN